MIEWMDFEINIEFAHTSTDQLGILGTKIENENFFLHESYYLQTLILKTLKVVITLRICTKL